MEIEQLKAKIKAAGVVGAGGAGFPAHMKLTTQIDTVLINAAECEPLLYTDLAIMREHLDMVCGGASLTAQAMGASLVLLCIKRHTAKALGLTDGEVLHSSVVTKLLPDVYPLGDELLLIYQALVRVVPPGQLPSFVGVVVYNVETAYNIYNAAHDIPVTQKWLTIGGSVPKPMVVRVPVGASVSAVLRAAGATVPEDFVVLDGGPAMGVIINPLVAVVTKKTKALLVLPADIPAIIPKTAVPERLIRRTPSSCCQCMLCTDMCPRHLIGYPLQPHKTLRSMGTNTYATAEDLITTSLCSGCGLCTLVACCQGVTPSAVMTSVKSSLAQKRISYKSTIPTTPNSERDYRMVPSARFMSRIGVARFDKETPWAGDLPLAQQSYILPLSQHVGKPAVPVVKEGDPVKAGQLAARADDGISAAVHVSVDGVVLRVTPTQIEIMREV